jgi:hypothetical protein
MHNAHTQESTTPESTLLADLYAAHSSCSDNLADMLADSTFTAEQLTSELRLLDALAYLLVHPADLLAHL